MQPYCFRRGVRRGIRRGVRRGALASLLGCVSVLTLMLPASAWATPNPPTNLFLNRSLVASSCTWAPQAAACLNAVVYQLDRARTMMHLPPYRLPHDFFTLTPAEQLFVLVNLDRIAYHIAPIVGLNNQLDHDAMGGVRISGDPTTQVSPTYASDWAGGYSNALSAYYDWVYADGYHSTNIDCRQPQAKGCWGHRENILWSWSQPLTMGAAAGPSRNHLRSGLPIPGYGLIIVSSPTPNDPPANIYTWQHAVAAGAGRARYHPGQPLTLRSGSGRIRLGHEYCPQRCVIFQRQHLPIHVIPPPGQIFTGWSGSCHGHTRCQLMTRPTTVQAIYARPHQQPTQHHIAHSIGADMRVTILR